MVALSERWRCVVFLSGAPPSPRPRRDPMVSRLKGMAVEWGLLQKNTRVQLWCLSRHVHAVKHVL